MHTAARPQDAKRAGIPERAPLFRDSFAHRARGSDGAQKKKEDERNGTQQVPSTAEAIEESREIERNSSS
jgi:hypothetical protein